MTLRLNSSPRSARPRAWWLAIGTAFCAAAVACSGGVEKAEGPVASADDGAEDDAAGDEGAADEGAAGNADEGAGDEGASDDGTSANTTPEPAAPANCDAPAPGLAPLRRLTNAEYINTATDLVGDADLVARVTKDFPREPTSLGFRSNAQALTVTPLIADQYLRAAEELGKAAIAQPGVVPCELTSVTPECTQGFVESFGQRVYRRPLATADLRRYSDLYNTVVEQTGSQRTAFEMMATAMFSSSHFLFRVELTQPGSDPSMPAPYEMASRISYLLWQTMPDAELFRAAAEGELATAEGVETQVKRMMGDAKALRVYEFFEQWLDIDESPAMTRSEDAYPDFDAELVELLRAENRKFIYELLPRGTFADLLGADYTYANQSLAQHYGLSEVPEGATFERVSAPERAGVLTQATLLMHDRPGRSSIVKRGLKVRTDFLCQLVPAPPDDVDTTLPELDGNLTQRQRLEQHRTEAGCAACHTLMDPIGEIFESYDALGRLRTTDEAGAAIVTGGTITNTKTLNGDYASARELGVAMGQSEEVRQCFALQAFRFFYGRDATKADRCTQEQLYASFARNDFRIVDLLIGLTQSDQFLYRAAANAPSAGGEQ